MLIAQVVIPGYYVDIKVRNFGDIPWHFIPFIKTIGEEKYGTNSMCYVKLRLRRLESSSFRRGYGLRAIGEREGEGANQGDDGGIGGHDLGSVWDPGFAVADRRRDLVWWCSGEEDYMVPSLPWRREGIRVVDVRQIVKLDIDVDIRWYDPNWLLEKKLQLLHSLGYKEEEAWWELSPSGKHLHVIIVLKDKLPVKELFDLQFLLGDDHKRAEFNFLRYYAVGEEAIHFNVLYRYKKSLTLSDKLSAIFRHWFKSLQYSKKRKEGHIT